MSRKHLFIGLVTIIAIVIVALNQLFPTRSRTSVLQVQFVTFIQSGLPEQDVFIEPESAHDEVQPSFVATFHPCSYSLQFAPGFLRPWMLPPPLSDPCAKKVDVVRPEPQEAQLTTFLTKQVFATTKVVQHDLYRRGPSPLGPFPRGDALGFTWGEWLAASGNGTYAVTDGDAQLQVSFAHLIPNGTYSLWCGTDTAPPNYSSFEAPCGNPDGSQNQFRADEAGNASLSLQLKPLATGKPKTALMLLSYDRAVPTMDAELGGYGLSNHVQLWFRFP